MTRTLRLIAPLILLVSLVGATAPAHGQSPFPFFDVGVRGGSAQATFYGNDVKINDWRSGFTGGVFARYEVNSFFSVQPELLYSVRGSKNLDYSEIDGPRDVRIRKDILEVPVLAKVGVPLSQIYGRLPSTIIPRGYVGPAVGIVVNTDSDGQDASDTFSSFDFGGVVGGEIAYAIDQGPLSEIAVDGRYNIGFANLGDTDTFEAVHSMSFVGSLSLLFSL